MELNILSKTDNELEVELKGETHEQGKRSPPLSSWDSKLTFTSAITAYSDALRITFISAIAFFFIVNVLIIPVKLPWLGKERVAADVDGAQNQDQEEGS